MGKEGVERAVVGGQEGEERAVVGYLGPRSTPQGSK